jgi:hypothetical protein
MSIYTLLFGLGTDRLGTVIPWNEPLHLPDVGWFWLSNFQAVLGLFSDNGSSNSYHGGFMGDHGPETEEAKAT